mmetsp:Transcript_23583/g.30824  ORF Transcript_23583/g.30824 Transcript_23583/m.30824 type:complete len:228 (+) Transcript_23583:127-810(+)
MGAGASFSRSPYVCCFILAIDENEKNAQLNEEDQQLQRFCLPFKGQKCKNKARQKNIMQAYYAEQQMQKDQQGQKTVQFEEPEISSEAPAKHRPTERHDSEYDAFLLKLRNGWNVKKFSREGYASNKKLYIDCAGKQIYWIKKKPFKLSNLLEVRDMRGNSLTLVFQERELDLTCESIQDKELMLSGFTKIWESINAQITQIYQESRRQKSPQTALSPNEEIKDALA